MTLLGRDWTDEQIEQWIGQLLRIGVLFAAGVTAIGGVAYLLHYGGETVSHATFKGVEHGLDSVHGVVGGAFALRRRWVVQLGLLLLIATPIARVALSLLAFLRQRDFLYVLVTAIVLGILLFGLLGPGVG